MKLIEISKSIVVEGGNIFKLPDGSPRTQRIALEDIPATIDWLEKVSRLSLHDHTLGSVGKKSSSGDLDFVVDSSKISKAQLAAHLSQWAQRQGLDPKDYVRTGAEVHFLTPIRGDSSLGFVQTDFFVEADPNWMRFSMSSPGDSSRFTGAERNQLMSSLAKAQGMKYSWKNGLLNRSDESVISRDPNVIAQKLLGPRATASSLDSVEMMQKLIQRDPKLQQALRLLIISLNKPEALDSEGNPVMDRKTRKPKMKPPGEFRKTQEEAQRITELTGVKA